MAEWQLTVIINKHSASQPGFSVIINHCATATVSMTSTESRERAFESVISAATLPLNGQLPRPWMTNLTDPLTARVLIVGRNPARGYDAAMLDHARHLDALFNRNGQSCRGLYNELVGEPSLTRRNIDLLRTMLTHVGVDRVMETNVICYSSPMSADLAQPAHAGGRETGTAIFRLFLEYMRPRVLIAHGAGTIRDVATIIGATLPSARSVPGAPITVEFSDMSLILLPSLAPPAWNRWHGWARPHLEAAAQMAAAAVASDGTQ